MYTSHFGFGNLTPKNRGSCRTYFQGSYSPKIDNLHPELDFKKTYGPRFLNYYWKNGINYNFLSKNGPFFMGVKSSSPNCDFSISILQGNNLGTSPRHDSPINLCVWALSYRRIEMGIVEYFNPMHKKEWSKNNKKLQKTYDILFICVLKEGRCKWFL